MTQSLLGCHTPATHATRLLPNNSVNSGLLVPKSNELSRQYKRTNPKRAKLQRARIQEPLRALLSTFTLVLHVRSLYHCLPKTVKTALLFWCPSIPWVSPMGLIIIVCLTWYESVWNCGTCDTWSWLIELLFVSWSHWDLMQQTANLIQWEGTAFYHSLSFSTTIIQSLKNQHNLTSKVI
jgi:hypothetical protein